MLSANISARHRRRPCDLLPKSRSEFLRHVSLGCEQALEVRNRLREAVRQRYCRLPTEKLLRLADIGLALLGIILRQWSMNDFRTQTR